MSENVKDVYWVTHTREIAGNYSYTINGRQDTAEYVVEGEDALRQRYEALIKQNNLHNLAPDIAAFPGAIDAVFCSKEKTVVLFCDQTELNSTHKFKGAHDQIVKMRLKNLVAASKNGERDWLIASDDYQTVMVRKSIVKRIYQENTHVMFEFNNERPDYLSDWDTTPKATEYLAKFQEQMF
ncbi:hypothetical protein [Suttonella indologenes]|uniref:Uncharacterized protein n=1 Tax=Suttonella indologenes TaxID=13276 RepID=A0A380N3I4_9GAMM|nr:hypothetical protein [Suttonella indologenes]SUO98481.1 Uncharacterised protein [Suttonella indologenes]